MPIFCQKHAVEMSERSRPDGPCSPSSEWIGGRGNVVTCDVIAHPDVVDAFADWLLHDSTSGRAFAPYR